MAFIPDKITLLYIEDDALNAEATRQMLEESKHTKFKIVIRETMKLGLEYLKDECVDPSNCNVDVVLLDLMLPNSKGVDTYKIVREACPFLPIVIISGYEDMACECVKLGAQDYLLKDDIIHPRVLIRSLKYAIERDKISKKLVESKEKYKELVEATHAAIYEINFVDDKFIYVNDVMCKLTGWSREEFMEMKPSELLTEESRKLWAQRWAALQRGEFIPSAVEYEAYTKDGPTIWTLLTARYTEDKNGSVIGARVVAIDITDRKVAQEEVERKEEIIFTELESRIKKWKDEMSSRSLNQEHELQEINLNIMSMTNKVEVL